MKTFNASIISILFITILTLIGINYGKYEKKHSVDIFLIGKDTIKYDNGNVDFRGCRLSVHGHNDTINNIWYHRIFINPDTVYINNTNNNNINKVETLNVY